MKTALNISDPRIRTLIVIAALAAIFVFSWWIRALNNLPDRILSFDPIFQYRFTRYFAEHGVLPVWDELTYYVGHSITPATNPPLLFYVTGAVWWIMQKLGWSLMTTASSMSALYGAAITIPAFLLASKLSNRRGGLLAAALAGTAPQILTRTFGASFDTDQFALFFILLTLWAGFIALRKRTPASFCLMAGTFIAFLLAWADYWFTFFVLLAGVFTFFVLEAAQRKSTVPLKERTKDAQEMFLVLGLLFVVLIAVGFFLGSDPFASISDLTGFAQHAETWIVNISIAELQLVNISDPSTWMLAFGRFVTGESYVDNLILLSLVGLLMASLVGIWKRGRYEFAMLTVIAGIGILTVLRGIRFTEFSSAMLLIGVGAGWGYLLTRVREPFVRSTILGLGMMLIFIGASIGLQYGRVLGPDISTNWDAAWAFLRTTPEDSLVGTWWDPGHMITGLGERRVIADGAHCGTPCLLNINDRITDLGKVFDTASEDEAVSILHKYQGTSGNIYWIASDDLVSKFQWLEYFGTGCDARTDANCQLYMQLPLQSAKQTQDGRSVQLDYGSIQILQTQGSLPVPIIVQGRSAIPVDEIIQNSEALKLDANDTASILPLINALNLRMLNQTAPYTVAISPDAQYVTVIPPNIRNSLFTKMFFLEGKGLQRFKQVFSNAQVKIYQVV